MDYLCSLKQTVASFVLDAAAYFAGEARIGTYQEYNANCSPLHLAQARSGDSGYGDRAAHRVRAGSRFSAVRGYRRFELSAPVSRCRGEVRDREMIAGTG